MIYQPMSPLNQQLLKLQSIGLEMQLRPVAGRALAARHLGSIVICESEVICMLHLADLLSSGSPFLNVLVEVKHVFLAVQRHSIGHDAATSLLRLQALLHLLDYHRLHLVVLSAPDGSA